MPIFNVVGDFASLEGSLQYKGAWNADTNTPALADGGVGGVKGDYYVVSVAGTTSIDGENDWQVGDWIVHNGTTWEKLDNSERVEFPDDVFRVIDDVVPTKKIAFDASGLTNPSTRVITMPDKNVTLDDAGDPRDPNAHAASHQDGGADEISVAGLSGALADPQTPASHASSHENGGADEISVAGLSGVLADAQTPASHASSHENGGADEISVAGLSGVLADAQTPASHASSHENGGADEISVAGLSGVLADAQTPASHASSHENGGADEISVAGLSGLLADNQNPTAHASEHTDGTDDIQSASGSQKGLVDTAAQTFAGLKTFSTPARMSSLNTGDNIITTDTDGDLQESGAKVETAPAGGSGFTLVKYASAPVSPDAGFLWVENVDANTIKLAFYDGSDTFSVQLSKE